MHMSKTLLANTGISQFMTKRVHTVAPDEALHMAILLMNSYKVSRIVVVKNDHPVGIITGRGSSPCERSAWNRHIWKLLDLKGRPH